MIPAAHIEMSKSIADSVRYCKKLETRIDGPLEFGLRPKGAGPLTVGEAMNMG